MNLSSDVVKSSAEHTSLADRTRGPHSGAHQEQFLVAFSGGGAKGLVHIGAYKHIHDSQKQIACVAGTSAGAIVAALIAAGFKPDELLKQDGSSPLWSSVQEKFGVEYPSDLLGSKFKHLTKLYGHYVTGRWVSLILELFGWWTSAIALIIAFFFISPAAIWVLERIFAFFLTEDVSASIALESAPLIYFISTFIFLSVGILRAGYRFKVGVTDISRIEEVIEYCLKKGLNREDDANPVLFEHLTEPPLKVVATNVTTCEPKVFSTDGTPKHSVASAVAASICLPYVFPSKSIDGDQYFDGGIASNLPAWVFEQERLMAPNLRAVAFQVEQEADESPMRPLLAFVGNCFGFIKLKMLLRSVFIAHQGLGLRSLVDLNEVTLRTKFHVLQFKIRKKEAAEILAQGLTAAASIDDYFSTVPDIYCDLAEEIRFQASSRLRYVLKDATGIKFSSKRIRVAFAVHQPQRPGTLWIKFSSGFRKARDAGITIPMRTSTAGLAHTEGRPRLTFVGHDTIGVLEGKTDGFLRSLVGSSGANIKWIFALPINLIQEVRASENDEIEHLQSVQKQMIVTIDGLDDILDKLESPSEIERYREVMKSVLWISVADVFNRRVSKMRAGGGVLDEFFPSLENAASKHI